MYLNNKGPFGLIASCQNHLKNNNTNENTLAV